MRTYVEVLEHRLAAGNPAGKVVHHLNHVKTSNGDENLQEMTPAAHAREHFSLIDLPTIRVRYEKGESIPALSASTGFNAGALSRALRRGGTQMRTAGGHNKISVDEDSVVRRLRAGDRQSALAEELGVSRTVVDRIRRKYGIPSALPGRPAQWVTTHPEAAHELGLVRHSWEGYPSLDKGEANV